MITRATKKEGLWFILETNPKKAKGVAPSDLHEKKEFLLYTMTQSINLGLLGKLTKFDLKELWNFFKINFEISNNSHKFHFQNKLGFIMMIEENTFE
jgi:hypothetical protein